MLPIVPYRVLDDAIRYVAARPRPLALYYFGRGERDVERVLRETHSGGVTINDVILHIAQDDLPFGGVGETPGSAITMARDGFLAFSKAKGGVSPGAPERHGHVQPALRPALRASGSTAPAMNRRRFIKTGLIGGAVLAAGGAWVVWRDVRDADASSPPRDRIVETLTAVAPVLLAPVRCLPTPGAAQRRARQRHGRASRKSSPPSRRPCAPK